MKKLTIVLMAVFVFTLALAVGKTFVSLTHPTKFTDSIVKYSNEFNLVPEMVASVINVESGYDKNAVSKKGALGLMQIKLSTAQFLNEYFNINENLTEKNLFNADTNIKYGCMYLNYLNKKFEDDYTALASYNAGETIVRSWLNNKDYSLNKTTLNKIPFEETKNYISKIKSNLKFYKRVFN